jgi:hypothetical protein
MPPSPARVVVAARPATSDDRPDLVADNAAAAIRLRARGSRPLW